MVQTLDGWEWRSVKLRACAYSTSDRTAHKKIDSCKVWGTYVPNLVKIGLQITSHSCPQTPDGRTDGRFTWFYSLSNAYAYALDRQWWNVLSPFQRGTGVCGGENKTWGSESPKWPTIGYFWDFDTWRPLPSYVVNWPARCHSQTIAHIYMVNTCP